MIQSLLGPALANGLRQEFTDTYSKIRNRQADSRLSSIMDLGLSATNREHDFAYVEAAPHMEQWLRGQSIPVESMNAVGFTVPIYTWGKRVQWHADDRQDDQTGSLLSQARGVAQSAALMPERFLFDMISGTASTLPLIQPAPDGAALYSATDGSGAARFGASGGNIVTGSGVASSQAIKDDYYSAIEQYHAFQDGRGQPLLSDEIIDGGAIIIHPSNLTQEFEETFIQLRQGMVMGTDAGTTPSNVIIDSSRNVQLWGTSRLNGTNDWYVILNNAPTKPFFYLDRQGIIEEQALVGDNNSDQVRDTRVEYVQWSSRSGAGIALPYATIKINN